MLGEGQLREVALRLWRRHLHCHLWLWRKAREQLEAARRCRQKRARLLTLARRHGLRLAEERLQEPGYNLSRTHHGLFCHYEAPCTREYRVGLQERLLELRSEWRELRRQGLAPTLANLQGLLEETEVVHEAPFEVGWLLPDLYLDGVWIGDLEILLNLEEFQVRVYNRTADTEPRGGYQHPHVNSSGDICWNGYDREAEAYHRSGDFLALKDLITNLLQTYNPASPYINLEDWENGLGDCCAVCGERYPEDDLVYVESLSDVLCPECRSYCERCDQYVHYRDYRCDLDRGWEMCKWCAEEYTSACSECGEQCLNDDLYTVEVPGEEGIEVRLLCEDCYEEYLRRKEEEDDEATHDATGVLAPAVAVSPE